MDQSTYIKILEDVAVVDRNINKLSRQANAVESKINSIVDKKLPKQIVKSAKDAAKERLAELNNIYDEDALEKYIIKFLKYFFPDDFPLGLTHRSEIGVIQGAVFIYKFNKAHNVSNARSVVSSLLFVADNLIKFSQFGGKLKMEDLTRGVKKYTNSSVFGVIGSIISLIINALFTLPYFILKGISYAFGIGFVKMAFRKLSGKPMLDSISRFAPSSNWATKIFKFFGIGVEGESARRLVSLTSDPMVKYFILFSIALPIVFVFFRLVKIFIITLKGSNDDKNAPIVTADSLKNVKESTENIRANTIKKYKLYKESGLIEYCQDNYIIKCFRESSEQKISSLVTKVHDQLNSTSVIDANEKSLIKKTSNKTINELQDMGNMDDSALKKYIGSKVFEKYNLPKDLRIGALKAARIAYNINKDAGRNSLMCFVISFFIFIRFIYFVVTRQNVQSKLNSEIAKTVQHPFLYWLSTTLAIAIPTMIAMTIGYVKYKGGIPQAIGAAPEKSMTRQFGEISFVVACLYGLSTFVEIVALRGVILPLAIRGVGWAVNAATKMGVTSEMLQSLAAAAGL